MLRQLRKINFFLIAFCFLLVSYISYVEWGRDWLENRQLQREQSSQQAIEWAVATIESQIALTPMPQMMPVTTQESVADIAAREATIVAQARAEGEADAQATASANSLQQVTLVAMETSQAIAVSQARTTAIAEAEATSVAQMSATVGAYREQYDSFLQAQVMATVQASYQSDIETVRATSSYGSSLILVFVFAFILGNLSFFFGMMYFSKPQGANKRRRERNQLVPLPQQFVTVRCSCGGQPVTCRACDGVGEILQFDPDSNQHLYTRCDNCRGTGNVQCERCSGEGTLYRKRGHLVSSGID